MNEILKNLPTYFGMVLGGYTALLFGTQAVALLFSEKINSQEHLDKVVNEEADKLGLDKRTLVGRFYAPDDSNYSSITGARCFVADFVFEERTVPIKVVEIKSGAYARRNVVRHELYHLANHFPIRKNSVARCLGNFFYEEPTAILYESTGIKL